MLWQQILLIIVFFLVIVFVVRPLRLFPDSKWSFLLDFASAPVIGVLFLLAITALSPEDVRLGLKGAIDCLNEISHAIERKREGEDAQCIVSV